MLPGESGRYPLKNNSLRNGDRYEECFIYCIRSGSIYKNRGLADVVGALPKYFNKDEFDVRVMIPKYTCIPWEYRGKDGL